MPQKVQKQAEANRDGLINPQYNNLKQFKHEKYLCSRNASIQAKSIVELGYMCPRRLSGPLAVMLTKYKKCSWKYKKILLLRCIHHS